MIILQRVRRFSINLNTTQTAVPFGGEGAESVELKIILSSYELSVRGAMETGRGDVL